MSLLRRGPQFPAELRDLYEPARLPRVKVQQVLVAQWFISIQKWGSKIAHLPSFSPLLDTNTWRTGVRGSHRARTPTLPAFANHQWHHYTAPNTHIPSPQTKSSCFVRRIPATYQNRALIAKFRQPQNGLPELFAPGPDAGKTEIREFS